MRQVNDKSRERLPPKGIPDKRGANQTLNDLEVKATSQVKGGRRITADPDEGGE